MHQVPFDYWDFILKATSDFSAEVKAIAAKAKMKVFPEVSSDVIAPD